MKNFKASEAEERLLSNFEVPKVNSNDLYPIEGLKGHLFPKT